MPLYLCIIKTKEVWLSGRKQHSAKVSSRYRLRRFESFCFRFLMEVQFSWQNVGLQNRRSEVRILLLLLTWNLGRHGVCAGLKILRTWFESMRFHQIWSWQFSWLECLIVAQVVTGSSPVFLPKMLLQLSWIEYLATNERAAGSNPARSTRYSGVSAVGSWSGS